MPSHLSGSGDYQEPLSYLTWRLMIYLMVYIMPASIEHLSHHGEEVEGRTVCDSCY